MNTWFRFCERLVALIGRLAAANVVLTARISARMSSIASSMSSWFFTSEVPASGDLGCPLEHLRVRHVLLRVERVQDVDADALVVQEACPLVGPAHVGHARDRWKRRAGAGGLEGLLARRNRALRVVDDEDRVVAAARIRRGRPHSLRWALWRNPNSGPGQKPSVRRNCPHCCPCRHWAYPRSPPPETAAWPCSTCRPRRARPPRPRCR